jgi:hypothetical protein
VFIFGQTPRAKTRQISRLSGVTPERIMPIPKNDKHKDYARYAAHCLDMVTTTKDQEARSINREMAAEWLKLADAILHPLKPVK